MNPGTTDIRVTILGSGTCVPSLERSSCAVLVETGSDRLLFDLGPGTMHRLLETGRTIFDVTHLFLSHFHPDHSGELAPFLFANKYPDGAGRTRPLTVIAGTGFARFFQKLEAVYGHWIALAPDLFHTLELDNTRMATRSFPGFSLAWAPVRHNPESCAYRVTAPSGLSVVYSGDTDDCPDLIELATGADILICESALPDQHKIAGHMTPSEAGETASRARVGKLVLTHFYPVCDTVDIRMQCRKTWSGPLVLAQDRMTIDIDRPTAGK